MAQREFFANISPCIFFPIEFSFSFSFLDVLNQHCVLETQWFYPVTCIVHDVPIVPRDKLLLLLKMTIWNVCRSQSCLYYNVRPMVKISPQVIIRTKLCFYYTVFCSLSLLEGGLAKKNISVGFLTFACQK